MADFYTNNATRNVGSYSTHNPTIAQIVYYGILKIWNGLTWVAKTLKRFNGSTWENVVLKYWSGTEWLLIKTS